MEFIATAKIGLESTVAFQLHKLGIPDKKMVIYWLITLFVSLTIKLSLKTEYR